MRNQGVPMQRRSVPLRSGDRPSATRRKHWETKSLGTANIAQRYREVLWLRALVIEIEGRRKHR